MEWFGGPGEVGSVLGSFTISHFSQIILKNVIIMGTASERLMSHVRITAVSTFR